MPASLEELRRYLDHLEGRAPLDELMEVLRGTVPDLDDLASYMQFSSRCYARNLVASGEWYNMLVLCWRNGQRSPIHDHEGSSCAVRVLLGTMTETLFEFAPNGMVKASGSRDYACGSVIGSEDFDLHQVSNLQVAPHDLVTLHVYSPPLLRMGTYSITDDSRGHEMMLMEFSDAAGI